MKRYPNESQNFLYFLYRLVKPIFDPITFFHGVTGYFWYVRDMIEYKNKDPKSDLLGVNMFPVLDEKVSLTPFDAHYFHQQLWVFENVLKSKPAEHTDIASTYHLSGYLSKIVKTTFIDYRPIEANLKNLKIEKGNILDLDYKDSSVESLSCLHVIEHIGLGRYGDPIDPEGTLKACRELSRILKKDGTLYLSTPIGKERICFNAHRVSNPTTIIKTMKDLKLIQFNVVDDEGRYIENADYKKYQDSSYACGMFLFKK